MKFLRQDAHKKVRLGNKWRRPRGWQNKVRLCKKGYRKSPNVGYGTPKKDEAPVLVKNLSDLENAKGKTVMLGKVGMKKKIELIETGMKQNIKFGFDYKKLLEELKKQFKDRSDASKALRKEKAEKEKTSKAKETEEKKEEAKEKSAEEKKKELDKALIQTK